MTRTVGQGTRGEGPAGVKARAGLAVALLLSCACGPRKTDHRFDVAAQAPGLSHQRTVESLPPPKTTRSATNDPHVVPRPRDAWPHAPAGFRVSLYAEGLVAPRALRRAPNGDVLVTHRR